MKEINLTPITPNENGEYVILTGQKNREDEFPTFKTRETTFESFTDAVLTSDAWSANVVPFRSMLVYSREDMEFTAYLNRDEITDPRFHGKITRDERLDLWKINRNDPWIPRDLARLVRFRAADLYDAEKAGDIVAKLYDFKAKVEKDIESMSKEDGTKRKEAIEREIIIRSEKIDGMQLHLPVIKGGKKHIITLGVRYEESGGSVVMFLESPELEQMKEHAIDGAFEDLLDAAEKQGWTCLESASSTCDIDPWFKDSVQIPNKYCG